ncbi:phage tail tape measure protein [Streptomyces corynorhini]|uniref:Phage tail tape measure protein n=1 Tax=Streptomyces corynorhini TaxID=2282652 RepID=A0A370B828_9ACTN|nr:phage tail tape measure protein [Streptomyces corynorhini]RDG37967.1 phage tail tape measure protein [Streptomyces corynorhini]
MATAGYGVLQIIPSMRGIEGAIRRQLGAPAVRSAATAAGRDVGGRFSDGLSAGGKAVKDTGAKLTSFVTAPIAAIGIGVIKTAGDFQKSMNKVKAVSGATGDEFEALRNQAKDLGATTQYSAGEAADAMGFLAMAGFKTKDIMTALPGVLNLAAAGNIDLAQAADIASNVLSGYAMKADEISRVNDVMARTFTSSNVDMTMLGESMKYVAPVASALGVEFEETSAAIGLLGNAGIQGSQAGTTLRMSLARLAAPPKRAAAALNKLGIQVKDSSGKMLPLVDIIGQLEKAGADTSQMMAIFGIEAGPGMQALVSQGSKAMRTLTQDLRDSGGTAEHIATVQMEGFNGALIGLKSALEGLAIEIADAGILDWATQFATVVTGLVRQVSAGSPQIFKLGTVVALVAAIIGPALVLLGIGLTGAGTALTFLLSPVGALIGAAVLLGGALAAAYATSRPFRDFVNDLAGRALRGLIDTFQAVKAAALDQLLPALARLWQTFGAKALPPLMALATTLGSKVMPVLRALAVVIVGTLGPVLIDIGRWLLAYVLPPALTVADVVGGVLLTALVAVVMAGIGVVTWLRDMGVWLTPLAILIGGVALAMSAQAIATGTVTAVFALYRTAILLGTAVTNGFAVAQGTLTAVMALNPITLIVIALVALGAALVIAWKHSDTFRAIVTGAWDGIKSAVSATWGFLQLVFDGFMTGLRAIGAAAMWLWNNALSPAFGFIGMAARILATIIVVALVLPAVAAFKAVGAIAAWLWGTVLQPLFTNIGALAVWLWTTALKPSLDAIAKAFGAMGSAAVWLWNNGIKPSLDSIASKAKWLWNSGVKPPFDLLKKGITSVGDGATWLWSKAVRPSLDSIADKAKWLWNGALKISFDLIKSGVGKMGAAFERAKDAIKRAWDKLEGISRTPVKFIIGTVYNGGIVPTWNRVAKAFGAPTLSEQKLPAGFARGGPVYGAGTETSDDVPAWLSRDEHVWAAKEVRGAGGHGAVLALRKWAAAGGTGDAPGFAQGGGLFGWVKNTASKGLDLASSGISWLKDGIKASAQAGMNALVKPLIDKISGSASLYKDMVTRVPKKMLTSLFDFSGKADTALEKAGIGGKGFRAGLAWARTQAGKKYQWGGNGNPSWDCSGLVSAIESVIRGEKPHRRWATGAFSGATAPPGWVLGAKSPYMIGITNRGVGHTAGTINGTNVESRGGDGVVIGSRARSYMDPLFTHRYALKTYDNGGQLPPGYSTVYNGTRRPERVLTDRQWDALSTAAHSGTGGDTHYTINARTADFTVRQLDTLQRQQEARARVGRPR